MLISGDKQKLVSIILPVYNGEKYIGDAIDSILGQSYTQFELIVLNDGSKDGTAGILSRYKRFSNVSIIERENRGLVDTLNEGIERSNGAFILRMDADDISLKHRLETQMQILNQNKLDIVGSDIRTFGKLVNNTRRYYTADEKLKFQLNFASCFAHPTILGRKELFTENQYDKKFEKIEDYELWVRLATKGYRFGNCPVSLLKYRVHKTQTTNASRSYQDSLRIGIAQKYATAYFSGSHVADQLPALLRRDFASFDAERLNALDKLYYDLVNEYPEHSDIINYHFFLCYLHNRFKRNTDNRFINQLSLIKRGVLVGFNYSNTLKKIPVISYRSIFG